jgi:hypothetical protein
MSADSSSISALKPPMVRRWPSSTIAPAAAPASGSESRSSSASASSSARVAPITSELARPASSADRVWRRVTPASSSIRSS